MFSLVLSMGMITTAQAYESDDYSYNYQDYASTIENITVKDSYTESEIVENDVDVDLIIDKDMRYVTVNGESYTFEDFNSAMEIQANALYDEKTSMTILEALKSFTPINDLETYLKSCDSGIIMEKESLNKGISPNGYGTYYYIGQYSKDILIALTTASISAVYTFATKGASGFALTKANVKSWIKKFLSAVGRNSVKTKTYVRRWQATLNVHATVRERREEGFKSPNSSSIRWSGEYYYRTFETQRS